MEQLLIIFDFQVLNIGFIIKYVYGKVLKLIDFDLLYLREMFQIKKIDFDNENEFDICVFFIIWFYCNIYVD